MARADCSERHVADISIASCSICASVMRFDVLAPYMRSHSSFENIIERNPPPMGVLRKNCSGRFLSRDISCAHSSFARGHGRMGGGEEVGGWDEEERNPACHTCKHMCCLPPNLFSWVVDGRRSLDHLDSGHLCHERQRLFAVPYPPLECLGPLCPPFGWIPLRLSISYHLRMHCPRYRSSLSSEGLLLVNGDGMGAPMTPPTHVTDSFL